MSERERNPSSPVKHLVWKTGVVAGAILLFIFIGWWVFTSVWSNPVLIGGANRAAENTNQTKNGNKLSPEEEVNQAVADIRSRVSSVKIQPGHLIFKDAPTPRFQYLLTIIPERKGNPEDAVYLFDRYKYVIQTAGDESKIPTANLCEIIDVIYDRKEPILESLREVKLNGKISFPLWKVGSAELEAGNLTPIIVDLLYSIRKFVELKTTHPEIIIKGYADGQKGDWSEELLKAPHDYNTIPVYLPADPSNTVTINVYTRNEQPQPVSSPYRNKDLPDLRAFFVKKDLVDPYLQECRSEKKIESHLIKGGVFEDKTNAPLERKVQVYILIYDN
jgi:hypothetical protein